MNHYISAERLKCKHTALNKLSWAVPCSIMILSMLLTGNYFAIDYYNWWYVTIMPVMLALSCCMFSKIDSKMKYRAILSLPLSRQKMWFAKVFVMIEQLVFSNLIMFVTSIIGVKLLELLGIKAIVNVSILNILFASLIISIVSIWQIPLSLFLAEKIGMFPSIIVNTGGNIIGAIFFSLTKFWIFIPYSYAARLMCPILNVLPNGLEAKAGSMTFKEELLSGHVVAPGIIISLVLFLIITFITGKWFGKREAV
ncbi:MAG: lantibiotic immunity ABC transporter MutE/EpiE family permease subunit [Lachnotalea sp.]